jgi:hypothetical protein
MGGDSPDRSFFTKRENGVGGTTNLEGPSYLPIFALEQGAASDCRIQAGIIYQRCFPNMGTDPFGGTSNI